MPPKPEQLELIDVLPKDVKKIRDAIRQRDGHHDDHLTSKKKADELDKKIWEMVQAAGGKLDNMGTLSIKLGAEEVLNIKRGEARLSIKVKSPKADDADGGEDDDSDADGNTSTPRSEPPPAPNRKGKHE